MGAEGAGTGVGGARAALSVSEASRLILSLFSPKEKNIDQSVKVNRGEAELHPQKIGKGEPGAGVSPRFTFTAVRKCIGEGGSVTSVHLQCRQKIHRQRWELHLGSPSMSSENT